jgi:hypothetical protein
MKKQLTAILLARTTIGSRHQTVALEMLASMFKRGYQPEILTVECTQCHRSKADCVRWTHNGQIVDSWGFMEFADGRTCSDCLGEGYIGTIIVPGKPRDN